MQLTSDETTRVNESSEGHPPLAPESSGDGLGEDHTPESIACALNERRTIPPFPDHFDEVVPHRRSARVDAINLFLESYARAGCVVACRSDSYVDSPHLGRPAAICLRPLEAEPWRAYFSQATETEDIRRQLFHVSSGLKGSVGNAWMEALPLSAHPSEADFANSLSFVSSEMKQELIRCHGQGSERTAKRERRRRQGEIRRISIELGLGMRRFAGAVLKWTELQPHWLRMRGPYLAYAAVLSALLFSVKLTFGVALFPAGNVDLSHYFDREIAFGLATLVVTYRYYNDRPFLFLRRKSLQNEFTKSRASHSLAFVGAVESGALAACLVPNCGPEILPILVEALLLATLLVGQPVLKQRERRILDNQVKLTPSCRRIRHRALSAMCVASSIGGGAAFIERISAAVRSAPSFEFHILTQWSLDFNVRTSSGSNAQVEKLDQLSPSGENRTRSDSTSTGRQARKLACTEAFSPSTNWLDRPKTTQPTDVAVVDFDGDGWPDILESNGGDEAKEPLVIVFNERAKAPKQVWQSAPDHYVRLAVGDLNHDGFPDIVASVASPPSSKSRDAAHIYLNDHGSFSSEPDYRISGFSSIAVGLGDFNGDGWLDITVGQYDSPDAPVGKSWQLVYFNQDGTFDFKYPSWKALIDGAASLNAIADFDQDGSLDLVVAAATATWGYQFLGNHDRGPPSLSERITAIGNYDAFGWGVVAFAASGRISGSKTNQLDLIVSFNTEPFSAKPTAFIAFDSALRRRHWASLEQNIGGGVALYDVDGDQRLDLIGAQWGARQPGGPYSPAPLRLYCSRAQGLDPEGIELGGETFVGQGVALGDLDRAGIVGHTFDLGKQRSPVVVTLPHGFIHAISKITWGARDITDQVARVHVANWVSIPLQENAIDNLRVHYESSTSLDVVVADRHPDRRDRLPVIFHR
jgi:hypothetical protein